VSVSPTKRLSIAHVCTMHDMLIRETGGMAGMRDQALLESAIHASFQTFDGAELYASLHEKVAQLGFGLMSNHPFVDGNKRVGMLAMMVFLEINGVEIQCTDQEIIDTGLALASGQVSKDQLLAWIMNHLK